MLLMQENQLKEYKLDSLFWMGIIQPRLDVHLFKLGPYHYYQGKGGLVETWPYKIVVYRFQVVLVYWIQTHDANSESKI